MSSMLLQVGWDVDNGDCIKGAFLKSCSLLEPYVSCKQNLLKFYCLFLFTHFD